MALGDGSAWDEANPQQSTLANTIDSHIKDVRIGARSRLAIEHIWPASQAGTAAAGYHTYITFQSQASVPTMPVPTGTATQVGMLFMTAGNFTFQNSAGSLVTLISSGDAKVNIIGARYSATGTLGEMVIGASGGAIQTLAPGNSGQIMVATTGGTGILWQSDTAQAFSTIINYGTATNTGTPIVNAAVKVAFGHVTLAGATANVAGLPFANATSYGVSVSRVSTSHTEAVFATNKAASSFVINGNNANNDVIAWIAIGS